MKTNRQSAGNTRRVIDPFAVPARNQNPRIRFASANPPIFRSAFEYASIKSGNVFNAIHLQHSGGMHAKK